VARETFVADWA
jgi:hypothetical protein